MTKTQLTYLHAGLIGLNAIILLFIVPAAFSRWMALYWLAAYAIAYYAKPKEIATTIKGRDLVACFKHGLYSNTTKERQDPSPSDSTSQGRDGSTATAPKKSTLKDRYIEFNEHDKIG